MFRVARAGSAYVPSRFFRLPMRSMCTASEAHAVDASSRDANDSHAVVASSSVPNSRPSRKSWEFLPHFSHIRERTLEEVAEEFKRMQPVPGNDKIRNMRPTPSKDMAKPKRWGSKGKVNVLNKDPQSPYPIAEVMRPKNERMHSEYGYQRDLYQKQLSLLRKKWMMEHIMEKERKTKLRQVKLEKRLKAESTVSVDPAKVARKKEVFERHQARMEMRKKRRLEKRQYDAEHFEKREIQMREIRMQAIDTLTRMSRTFFTAEDIDDRTQYALTEEENVDLDVEIPLRKSFDPNAERADSILRRIKGQR